MLYLVRGLPGSGKSTFAERLATALDACHHEADHFFHFKEGPSGTTVWTEEYLFDKDKLHKAHKACQDWTTDCMCDGCNIVVSNTFTTEKELKPYLALAAEHGYDVTTLIVEGRHGNPSIHDVPEETMTKMRNRFSVKL
jgi:predicted kinase